MNERKKEKKEGSKKGRKELIGRIGCRFLGPDGIDLDLGPGFRNRSWELAPMLGNRFDSRIHFGDRIRNRTRNRTLKYKGLG